MEPVDTRAFQAWVFPGPGFRVWVVPFGGDIPSVEDKVFVRHRVVVRMYILALASDALALVPRVPVPWDRTGVMVVVPA